VSTEVKKARYILSDVVTNHNKFWQITLYQDGRCLVEWGRVGDRGQSKMQTGGEYFFAAKCREKEKKGYELQRTLDAAIGRQNTALDAARLKQIAATEIAADPTTKALVDRLVEANVHNIMEALDDRVVTYDASAGTFSTPLGPVTQDAIDDARDLLTKMAPFVERSQFKKAEYIAAVNKYLRIVPQKTARKLSPETIYPTTDALQAQNQMLDALEASLKVVLAAPDGVDEAPRGPVFEAKLELVDQGWLIDRVRKLYKATRQSVHQSSNLDIKTLYAVEIAEMERAFSEDGAKLTDIWELWHGTKTANLLSIIKSGFLLPRNSPGSITGAMFGPGIYASDQSTKALNYASGYWSGRRDANCFMFVVDFAMGKYFVPPHSMHNLPKPGYDSTYAKARESGEMNNEMIVYRTSQVRPKYLVEFSPGGK
jgi:poly [ADP-ribose] polymerase